MTPTELLDDIPEDIARHAHRGTSFDPELRGRQERAEYAATLAADWEALSKLADTEVKRAELATEFERYRQGLRTHYVARLTAMSRCVSTMIAGASNFNTRRHQKSGDSADRRTQELLDFRKRALAAIHKVLRPEDHPVMSSDSNAAERLEDKIAQAERRQEMMKAANGAIRRHAKAGPDAQVAALVALGLPDSVARKLLQPDFAGRIGFPGYELTNNAANIRRMRDRVVVVERNQATPAEATDGANARIEDDPPANRVRLFFPGKPDVAVRGLLKSRGFRWTPSVGAWQAFRNPSSLATAREVAGVPA